MSTDVVARLCEVISGLPFDRYLHERVLEPLGMADTGFTAPGNQTLATFARTGGETRRAGQGFGLGVGVLLDPVLTSAPLDPTVDNICFMKLA